MINYTDKKFYKVKKQNKPTLRNFKKGKTGEIYLVTNEKNKVYQYVGKSTTSTDNVSMNIKIIYITDSLKRMDDYGSYYPPFPIYTEGNCPDTLAWDKETQFCSLECLYPFYKEAEIESLFIVDRVLAIIGFILCYFYCFTCLFRHRS